MRVNYFGSLQKQFTKLHLYLFCPFYSYDISFSLFNSYDGLVSTLKGNQNYLHNLLAVSRWIQLQIPPPPFLLVVFKFYYPVSYAMPHVKSRIKQSLNNFAKDWYINICPELAPILTLFLQVSYNREIFPDGYKNSYFKKRLFILK